MPNKKSIRFEDDRILVRSLVRGLGKTIQHGNVPSLAIVVQLGKLWSCTTYRITAAHLVTRLISCESRLRLSMTNL